ncbi:MAG: helix-hairpin-helix domain-containing protein [bacterium]|nr:helix-hairpin-helix domain-containing protein [bacterium]
MLRLIRVFLIVFFISTNLLFSIRTQAQVEGSTAPWRIEPEESVEVIPNPLVDLNSANYRTLAQIPGISPSLARKIIQYRSTVDQIYSIDELLLLPDCSTDLFDQIAPFIFVSSPARRFQIQATVRVEQALPPAIDKLPNNFGSAMKFRLADQHGISVGGAVEKDAGERLLWDHAVLALQAPLPGNIGNLVLGDFLASAGCGLVVNTQHNYGFGNDGIDHFNGTNTILRPYLGWSESLALRGAGVQFRRGSFDLAVWGSQRPRDAVIDSLGRITSFPVTGLHRTEAELAHQNAADEECWGSHLHFTLPCGLFSVGLTYCDLRWNDPVIRNGQVFENQGLGSLDLHYADGQIESNVEVAYDHPGNGAQLGDLRLKFDRIKFGFTLYHVDPDYFAPLASTVDFDLGQVRNREGAYAYLKTTSNKNSLGGFMHLYRYLARLEDGTNDGEDIGIFGRWTPYRGINLAATSRWTQEEVGSGLKSSVWRGGGKAGFELVKTWRAWSELDLTRSASVPETGGMIYLSISKRWRLDGNSGLEIKLKSGAYQADNYSVRLYWVIGDPSGSIRVRPVWERGKLLEISSSFNKLQLGRFEILAYWDQPSSQSNRHSTRNIFFVYHYP